MSTPETEVFQSEAGLSVTIARSEVDGVLVVFIDGADGYDADGNGGREDEHGPILRVHLNDGPIYANPPFKGFGVADTEVS